MALSLFRTVRLPLPAVFCRCPTAPPFPRILVCRHRASLGISEVSDAVAVVVSEEKGTISVFVGGVPKRPLTPATLEKLLRNELCPQDESQISRREQVAKWIAGLRKEGNEK